MPRDLSTGEVSIVTGKTIRPAFFVELQWPSGTARFWSGVGPIVVGDDTYTGTGDFGSVSSMKDSSDGSINGMTLTLSGVPSDLVSTVLAENYQYRIANVSLGLLDNSGALAFPPRAIFSGRMNVATDTDDGTSATITLSIEPRMIIIQRASNRRYTNEDQKAEYPFDTGLEYVAAVNSQAVDNWGVPIPGIAYRPYSQSQTSV